MPERNSMKVPPASIAETSSVERYGCAAACVDGLLYVVGGGDADGNTLASAECYDASAGQWRALPDMSIVRHACAAACVDGLLYVVGGDVADGNTLASVEYYDPSAGQWRALPDMSVARSYCAAAVLP